MKDRAALTADELLAIPAGEPEKLFTGELAAVKGEFHALAMVWHPDRHGAADAAAKERCQQVFNHIRRLYELAEGKLRDGIWHRPGELRLTVKAGKSYVIRYRKRHLFELGEMYIGRTIVAFVIAPENADFFANARQAIGGFRFADEAMRNEFTKHLPRLEAVIETGSCLLMVVSKTPDLVLLRDLLDRLGGAMDPRHVAWILSSLYNLACYLDWSGLAHNAMALDTYFISPEQHRGALLGGWWYARPCGEKLLGAPQRTVTYAPVGAMSAAIADPRTDLELIRALGRELLGDATGMRLDRKTPKPMLDWLRYASSGRAFREYGAWKEVLRESYGAPRFVSMGTSASDIYD